MEETGQPRVLVGVLVVIISPTKLDKIKNLHD